MKGPSLNGGFWRRVSQTQRLQAHEEEIREWLVAQFEYALENKVWAPMIEIQKEVTAYWLGEPLEGKADHMRQWLKSLAPELYEQYQQQAPH